MRSSGSGSNLIGLGLRNADEVTFCLVSRQPTASHNATFAVLILPAECLREAIRGTTESQRSLLTSILRDQ